MEIQKISPKTKENLKVVAKSAAAGACICFANAAVSGVMVTPKDIFRYSKLPVSRKKIIKTNAVFGLAMAISIAAEQFFQMKKNKKIEKI